MTLPICTCKGLSYYGKPTTANFDHDAGCPCGSQPLRRRSMWRQEAIERAGFMSSITQMAEVAADVAVTRALEAVSEKLDEMQLHNNTGHPLDRGYQAAVDEIRTWVEDLLRAPAVVLQRHAYKDVDVEHHKFICECGWRGESIDAHLAGVERGPTT